MNLSYWEYKTWLSHIDFTIVGSGIVGLNCALHLKNRFPKAKILVLEKGRLPEGASTKNAGFACFGSISEIIADLKTHSALEVQELVGQRFKGIELLRKTLGDSNIDFQILGGHELFLQGKEDRYETCIENLDTINELLRPVFGKTAFHVQPNLFDFKNIAGNYISNPLEGQLDTGKLMKTLLQEVQKRGIMILNSVEVIGYAEAGTVVTVRTRDFEFSTNKLLIATNGFAAALLIEDVKPARAQVLVTKPIDNLRIKGTFHVEEGYYYFRNIDERILLGGGRNLDLKGEETTKFGQTKLIQDQLEAILNEVILPGTKVEIDRRWSGIMGVGPQKRPIIRQLGDNVFCGVRLGGMGIAIGSTVGKELAALV